jgi:hypothetical protein
MSKFSSGRAHDNRLRGQARAVNVLISEKMVLDARVGNIVCFENKATFFVTTHLNIAFASPHRKSI